MCGSPRVGKDRAVNTGDKHRVPGTKGEGSETGVKNGEASRSAENKCTRPKHKRSSLSLSPTRSQTSSISSPSHASSVSSKTPSSLLTTESDALENERERRRRPGPATQPEPEQQVEDIWERIGRKQSLELAFRRWVLFHTRFRCICKGVDRLEVCSRIAAGGDRVGGSLCR